MPRTPRQTSWGGLSERGVTFVELMMVVAVLAVIALLALPTGITLHRRAQEKQLAAALVEIREAIDEYHRDWEQGYIESEHEHGWPESLEELHEGKEYTGPPPGQEGALPLPSAGGPQPGGGLPRARELEEEEPRTKVYLREIPRDPFNVHDDEWDVSGWRARSYGDEPDDTHWGREGVYDVYSGSDYMALDGRSRYPEW